MCRMSFKVSRVRRRGAGGCAFGLPLAVPAAMKCSVIFFDLGVDFVVVLEKSESGLGRKERKEIRSALSLAMGCAGSAVGTAYAFPSRHPPEGASLVLHNPGASVELCAGFRVARLSAVGFGAVGSLLFTFPVISASAGCVTVPRQLFVSGCGGY